MKPTLTAALATLIVLPALVQAADASTAASDLSAASPTSDPDVQISLSDMPLQRAGRWKVVEDTGVSLLTGKGEGTSFVCSSGKTAPVQETPACTRIVKRTAAGAYSVDSDCTLKTVGSWTSSLLITGDFRTHLSLYDTEVKEYARKYLRPGVEAVPPESTHQEETWVGRCRPGDRGWPGRQ